ncbi:hypothetical protein E4U52_007496, partial [Claviceps spartinae]
MTVPEDSDEVEEAEDVWELQPTRMLRVYRLQARPCVAQGMTLDLAIIDLKARAIFADITLEDIQPNVTRALELRRQDEANRTPQVMLPPLGPPMPRTRDLLTSRPLTFSTGASTGRREREMDRE